MRPITFWEWVQPYIHKPATPFSPAENLILNKEFEAVLKKQYNEYLSRIRPTLDYIF